ncbi:MAG: hypothetical protein A2Y66_07960 [Nitrospirae bacterium RBG_13_41_22]|nr:MAG: hypothetical protein A2Y66_07960 [Nitrospirae bacterium RBG_13_41_22]
MLKNPCKSTVTLTEMLDLLLSFPLVGNLSEPLFGKEGQGEILWRIDLFKNPPQSPFAKGGGNRRRLCQKGEIQRKIPVKPE